MGKRKTIRSSQTSKGERKSIAAGVREARASVPNVVRAGHKRAAWLKGKNPWITIQGPSPDKLFVRVKSNEVWGNPKTSRSFNIYRGKSDE